MTNISKHKLGDKHKKQLIKQLADLFSSTNTKKTAGLFTSLCTDAEQIMLVKRLATILMLDKGYSKYRISKTLLVSESTVREIRSRYDLGEYVALTLAAKQKEFDKEQFWETVESLVRLGMPSMGKDRWKNLK